VNDLEVILQADTQARRAAAAIVYGPSDGRVRGPALERHA
jgi:hypothetical protein